MWGWINNKPTTSKDITKTIGTTYPELFLIHVEIIVSNLSEWII